jgi:hypothetical protein
MPGLASVGVLPGNQLMVRTMTCKMCAALIASVGAVTLVLATKEAFAEGPRAAFASTRSMPHSAAAHGLRHHNRRGQGAFWPGDFDYGPSGEPLGELAPPPASGDVHYTYTHDVPWDWAHRYPPMVTPSDRPYVPGCTAESVTVPGRDGKEQTVNVTRCY